MALRSAGIPAAFELVPYWGSSNNGHSFAAAILPNEKTISFQNENNNDINDLPIRKVPKIYRKSYTIVSNQLHDTMVFDFPQLFKDCDIRDVTGMYLIGSKTMALNYNKNNISYLSVFSPNGWIPIAVSTNGKFSNIGTGTKIGEESEEALNLGNGILYLPSIFTNAEIAPLSPPIIVSNDSIREIQPNIMQEETITLTRKYPLNKRIVRFAQTMIGGIFEGANRIDFSDAEELYKITSTPESRTQKINITCNTKYKYIRYRKPKGIFSIAEFSLHQQNGTLISSYPIACEAIQKDSTMMAIFDNNPLTYYQVDRGIDLWIGMALPQATSIGAISFAPRNDDNSVVPTDTYELLYWNKGWNSLGEKSTTEDHITYNNVPKNALLWLRDLTKGKEERPFTYENGQQIWW